MLLFEFNYRLRKLNPRLYVATTYRRHVADGYYGTGIFLKDPGRQRGATRTEMQYGTSDQQRYLEAENSGTKDRFIMGCPVEWIPEYDVFNLETGRLMASGWRSVLMHLIKRGLIDRQYARRLFDCGSLGEATYDNLGFNGKLKFIRSRERVDAARHKRLYSAGNR